MKEDKTIAINVLLLPDQRMSAQAQEINDGCEPGLSQGISRLAEAASHVPHISILHRVCAGGELPKLFAAIERESRPEHQVHGWRLTASGLESSPWQGHQVTASVDKTS